MNSIRASAVVTACVVLMIVSAKSQTHWFKYLGNPVLTVGSPGSWDDQWVAVSGVVTFRDTLRMWYSGRKNPLNSVSIGYAWSTDGGITWVKQPTAVLSPGSGEQGYALYPYVVVSDSLFRMWYSRGDQNIGYAASKNGIAWTKYGNNPVVTVGGPTAWDATSLSPCVLGPDSTGGYKMWFDAGDASTSNLAIGYAEASSETTWTKFDGINPVLAAAPGTWEPPWVRNPRLLFDGQTYRMWYGGGPKYNTSDRGIGFATSSDGLVWDKDASNPVLRSTPGTWDDGGIWPGDILEDSVMYHMWYSAGYLASIKTGYAVSPKGMSVQITSEDGSPDSVGESIVVKVRVDNPKGLKFFARINKDNSRVDTLDLFDDGAHQDSFAADGIFANSWTIPDSGSYHVYFNLTLNDTLRFAMSDGDFVTSISDGESNVPTGFSLFQNYPNPFNPTTVIRYSLKERGRVLLTIHNVIGQEVASLVNQEQPAGTYEVTWDAGRFSSGVYICKLESGAYMDTKKLVLLR